MVYHEPPRERKMIGFFQGEKKKLSEKCRKLR